MTQAAVPTEAELLQLKKKKKKFMSMHAGLLRLCPTLYDPVDYGLPGFSIGGGFSRQEYWSVLANTGCHTLLCSA